MEIVEEVGCNSDVVDWQSLEMRIVKVKTQNMAKKMTVQATGCL